MSGDALIDELVARWEEFQARGEEISTEDLCTDHPELLEALCQALTRRRAERGRVSAEGFNATPVVPPTVTIDVVRSDDIAAAADGLGPPQGSGEIGRLGPFRLVKLLGEGGMGAVYQAVDSQLGRFVALKVMRPRLADFEEARGRFLREARAAAALEHDHVVPIYQVGEDNGVPYLAMPLLHGQSLSERLRRDSRLPVAEVLRIGREIAEGLAAAHEHGLVHRDIKPANIWIEEGSGRVKILDFGLARVANEAACLTQDGTILGTPAYMAPEQVGGGKGVDQRSDLFSLGSVLYRMVTGRRAFPAENTAALLLALVHEEPVPPRRLNPDVPPALDRLILQLLAKDPDERPQSAGAVVEALRGLEHPGEPAGPLGLDILVQVADADSLVLRPATRPASRRRWPVVLAAVIVPVLVIGGLAAGLAWQPRLADAVGNRGEMLLESPSPAVAVAITQKGRTVGILEPTARPALRLPAGSYALELSDATGALALATDRIALRRGGRHLVRLVRAAPPPPSARVAVGSWPTPTPDADDLPGLVPSPARLAGLGRWQVQTRWPRDWVVALSWSPDRRRLAFASRERVVRIYETERLELVDLLAGHGGLVTAVAWSPDGTRIASGSEDGTMRLWGADGTPGPVLNGHTKRITAVAWSRDGSHLASASSDARARIWDVDGTPGPVLEHDARVDSVAWSPDGRRLATASADVVSLWSADGTPGARLKGHSSDVLAVAWSPDGARLASASRDQTVRFWSADGEQEAVLKGHPSDVLAVAWSPDGARLASASGTVVSLFSADGTPGPRLKGHRSDVFCVAWSPDGKRLASGGAREVRLWDSDGTPGAVLAGHAVSEAVALRPDGTRLASAGGFPSSLLLWGFENAPVEVLKGHVDLVSTVAWSPDGKRLASAGEDMTVRLWDADGRPGPTLSGHSNRVHCVAWSPDGRRLASAGEDMTVRLWHADGRPGPVLNGHSKAVRSVAWSPDGTRIASAGGDGVVQLWRADGTPTEALSRNRAAALCVAWSPDGMRLAAGDDAGVLRLWRVGDRPLTAQHTDAGGVDCLAWHPDSQRLALGCRDGTVRLWDVNGRAGPILTTHARSVHSVAWTGDGNRLLAACKDGYVRAWKTQTLETEWVAFQTRGRDITFFSPAGRVLRSSTALTENFVYLVEQANGVVELLTYPEFEARAAGGK